MHWIEARDTLKVLREKQSRESKLIIELAEPLLKSSASRLGTEAWAVYEQACVAALDCGKDDLANEYHKKLEDRFGVESTRVAVLKGQILEAKEKWPEAQALYEKLLQADPVSARVMKRQIAILIAQQDYREAISRLNKYLKNFMGDFEAWMELANLYLKESQFAGAQFCFEELILSNPYHYVYHQRLAEVLYTIGGQENYELAQKHFAQAVKLSPSNIRALFGLHLVLKKANKPASAALVELCETSLKKLHKGKPAESVVNNVLKMMS